MYHLSFNPSAFTLPTKHDLSMSHVPMSQTNQAEKHTTQRILFPLSQCPEPTRQYFQQRENQKQHVPCPNVPNQPNRVERIDPDNQTNENVPCPECPKQAGSILRKRDTPTSCPKCRNVPNVPIRQANIIVEERNSPIMSPMSQPDKHTPAERETEKNALSQLSHVGVGLAPIPNSFSLTMTAL